MSRSTSWKDSRNPLQSSGLTTADGTDDFFHAPGGKYIYTRILRRDSRGRCGEPESRCFFEVRLRDGHAGDDHRSVNRVLQWGSLAKDRVFPARHE